MDTTGALLMKKVLSPLSSHTVAAALASRPIVTKPTRERQARREPARQSHSRYERARNACPSLSIRHLCVGQQARQRLLRKASAHQPVLRTLLSFARPDLLLADELVRVVI